MTVPLVSGPALKTRDLIWSRIAVMRSPTSCPPMPPINPWHFLLFLALVPPAMVAGVQWLPRSPSAPPVSLGRPSALFFRRDLQLLLRAPRSPVRPSSLILPVWRSRIADFGVLPVGFVGPQIGDIVSGHCRLCSDLISQANVSV